MEVRVLQGRVNSLEELADYHRNQLKDADWRYQETGAEPSIESADRGGANQGFAGPGHDA